MSEEEYVIISKNEKRNMMMVVTGIGKTHHIPIDRNKVATPKTGPHNPKGEKSKKKKKK